MTDWRLLVRRAACATMLACLALAASKWAPEMLFAYDPLLVVLSLLIAAQGGYVGFRLAARVTGDGSGHDRLLLVGAAASLATGIWSMHFIGMLALRFAAPLHFAALPTLLSLLICALVVGPAIYAIHAPLPRRIRVIAGGTLMGLGIAAMHYVGMDGLNAGAMMSNRPIYIAASLLIGIAGSIFAVWVIQQGRNRPPLWAGALIFALAVAGMHYVAVAGMIMAPQRMIPPLPPTALSANVLAMLVALVAFGISAAFLLSLVPRMGKASNGPDVDPVTAPLVEPEVATSVATLPVEQKGRKFTVALHDVQVIRANAHYTYISDAEHEYFCPLPISLIEAGLDHSRFIRVHRSYIVNVAHVVTLRRAGDAGVIEMRNMLHRKIPVARARVAPVKQCLATLLTAAKAPNASVMLTQFVPK